MSDLRPPDYFRPIALREVDAPSEALSLAGGWTKFTHVEHLRRDSLPRILPADRAPPAVLERLTAQRSPICGLRLDAPGIMGVVNVTPDSFSDGGRHDGPKEASAHGQALHKAGAAILDIGGESTRPGAQAVAQSDEIARVEPAIRVLSRSAMVSVDTRNAAVAAAALDAGACLVNDVSGLSYDPDMAALVAARGAGLCIMHSKGTPDEMQNLAAYGDVLLDVYDALERAISKAEHAGIPRHRILVDPGIGFAKTEAHNLALLHRISLFHSLGCGILLGVSRKGFVGRIGGPSQPDQRDPGTHAVTCAALAQGVQIHRVHDVSGAVQALALWTAATRGTT